MRIRLYLALLICAGICRFGAGAAPGSGENPRLNLLLVTIDTLRADRLGCYGGRFVATPAIDGLAEDGMLFARAFAHTSTTLPSHTNILLGTTPLFHGVHENSNFEVREELTTLAELLKAAGYATGAFVGAYPLDARYGLDQGFDVYDDEYSRISQGELERKAGDVLAPALKWLTSQKEPWFQWIHFYDPHDPYDPPEPYRTRFAGNPYEGEIAYVDQVMGDLLGELKKGGFFDDTLIVLTGDHGESLGQHGEETHGFFAYNTSIWIPLIISGPGVHKGRFGENVGHVDIFPTVCDLLGVAKPEWLQGTSLVPALKGKRVSRRRIYFESLYPFYSRGWAPLRGYIDRNLKYIDTPIPELYDLERDFNEMENLALNRKLDRYRKELREIMTGFSSSDREGARRRFDRKSMEKLASLGYLSGGRISGKESYEPRDDVKVHLPLRNKAMKAVELYELGRREQAFESLKQILTERDDIDSAYLHLAELYQKSGQTAESIQVLGLGHEKLPDNYLLFFTYLSALSDAFQYGRVIDLFSRSGFPQIEYDPEVWNILGIAYFRTGDLDRSIESYRQALRIDAGSPLLYVNLSEVLIHQSAKSGDPGLADEAVRLLNRAVELAPEFAPAYTMLGKAHRYLKNLENAVAAFEKALSLNSDLDEALFYLALSCLEQGDRPRALQLFTSYKNRFSQRLTPAQRDQLEDFIRQSRR